MALRSESPFSGQHKPLESNAGKVAFELIPEIVILTGYDPNGRKWDLRGKAEFRFKQMTVGGKGFPILRMRIANRDGNL